MSDLSDLYQEILLEHNSKPRNFRKLDDATVFAEGFNPLCGDQYTVYLKLDRNESEEGRGLRHQFPGSRLRHLPRLPGPCSPSGSRA